MEIVIKINANLNERNEIQVKMDIRTIDADIYSVIQVLEEVKRKYYEDYKRQRDIESILELLN